jgi:hypothetical protein
MAVTNLINLNQIKQEMVVFLRNSDIISISDRGVTTSTDEGIGTGDNVEVDFALAESNAKNVRNVKLDGSAQTFGTDYTVDYSTYTVTFSSAPGSGVAVTATYDYGSGDSIYPDFPRTDLGITSYPRMAVAVTSVATSEMGIGGAANINDILLSVYVYANGMAAVDDYIKDARSAFLQAKKDFYYLKFVTPVTQSPLINEPARGDKIYTRSLDIRALFNVEDIS